jgi:RNA polymerase sigma-70 factor (ECF subfamily)
MMVNGNVMANKNGMNLNWSEVRKIVLREASRLLTQDEDYGAEDATQDVLIKLMNTVDRFDGGRGDFKAWVVRITKNYCLDCIRKKKRSLESRVENENVFMYLVDDTTYEDKEGMLVGMETALERLGGRGKELLTYQFLEGKSGREIALLLNMPEAQVPMYVRRAKLKLRQLIDEKLAA